MLVEKTFHLPEISMRASTALFLPLIVAVAACGSKAPEPVAEATEAMPLDAGPSAAPSRAGATLKTARHEAGRGQRTDQGILYAHVWEGAACPKLVPLRRSSKVAWAGPRPT